MKNLDIKLCEKIKDKLSSIEDANVILWNDNTEERTSNMIVVGIDNIEQMNYDLPDFSFTMQIVVDTFITDDENAELFNNTKGEVKEVLEAYLYKDKPLSELFEDLPVVGFFFENASMNVEENSNRCSYTYKIITSE